MDCLDSELRAACEQWLELDPDEKSREEVRASIDKIKQLRQTGSESSAMAELRKAMCTRIAFGTAGLRAKMAPGNAYMNNLVVIQASQGLATYLLDQFDDARECGVVIGYDARYNSRTFAENTASVFLSKGFKVYFYREIVSTPMVPFAVAQLKCVGGVMVTASHNPKQDNGYKVYWRNSAQIIPPHDKGIADKISANLKPWQEYKFDVAQVVDPYDDMNERYFTLSKQYSHETKDNEASDVKVTYTAMHGVGSVWVQRAFEAFKLPPYIPVKEQVDPDPDFPTVDYPNPEEGKGALELAVKTAEANDSRLILANDPDADRLAVAERQPSGDWKYFNGNEIAALFADWVWLNYRKKNPEADASRAFMLASTVSSKFLRAMGQAEGFTFVDTLTGFKWMGNVAAEMESKGDTFLFAYEVEIGFLIGNISLDKDGVRTAAVFNEMAVQVYKRGQTLNEHLQSLYKKYGYFEMNTSYFFCDTRDKLDAVFDHLRTSNNGTYVGTAGKFKVRDVRDVTTGYDSSQPDNKAVLPVVADSHMITFTFENGAVATLRNSGTEPKLKYYVECNGDSKASARSLVDEMTAAIIADFLQPDRFGLVGKKS